MTAQRGSCSPHPPPRPGPGPGLWPPLRTSIFVSGHHPAMRRNKERIHHSDQTGPNQDQTWTLQDSPTRTKAHPGTTATPGWGQGWAFFSPFACLAAASPSPTTFGLLGSAYFGARRTTLQGASDPWSRPVACNSVCKGQGTCLTDIDRNEALRPCSYLPHLLRGAFGFDTGTRMSLRDRSSQLIPGQGRWARDGTPAPALGCNRRYHRILPQSAPRVAHNMRSPQGTYVSVLRFASSRRSSLMTEYSVIPDETPSQRGSEGPSHFRPERAGPE
ncbi:hypothetical protein LZ30DRAFT_815186 [Colletotrichum cereale]|nr:hypothetical protein LZ30DRAFT_815186 [Colletotrichum cereale]